MYLSTARVIIFILTIGYVESRRVKRIVGGIQAAPPPPDDPVGKLLFFSSKLRL